MISLNKNEKALYQIDSVIYLKENGFDCYVDHFVLTNQNIRIIYQRKINSVDREFANITIPVHSIKDIKYELLDDEYKLDILVDGLYAFFIYGGDLDYCKSEIDDLIQLLKK